MRYRIVEHPSDVGFEADGDSFPDLADAAVHALAAILVGGDVPDPLETRPAPAVEPHEVGLLGLLEACLFAVDADDWLPVAYRDGHLHGRPFDPAARENGVHVKAITWHHLAVRQDANGWHGTVFVDL